MKKLILSSTGWKQSARVLFLAVAALALVACGGGGSSSVGVMENDNTDFIVSGIPAVNTVIPNRVLPGGSLNVSGLSLNVVSRALINTTELAIAAQSDTALTLDVPNGAASGFLTLVDSAGAARQSIQHITILAPLKIAFFSPSAVLRGQVLTVTGSGLDRALTVQFGGGALAQVASHSGSASLTAVVPEGAASGAITLFGDLNDSVTSSDSLNVADRIVVDEGAVYQVGAGEPVTVLGSGLAEVKSVSIAGSPAMITSQTDIRLTFQVPDGVFCGAITLFSSAQPAVAGGSVNVGNGCTVRSAGIEFAQVYSQAASDGFQRLVPQKETWTRVYVVAETSGMAAPAVKLTAFNGSELLGTLTMSGPAVLPVLAAGYPLPDSLRYDEAQSFNASLPAQWVATGLQVAVEIDGEERYGSPLTLSSMPAVGAGTEIDVVVVPLVSGDNVPQMPTMADVLDELTLRLPVPREKITVALRPAYTLTSVTDGVSLSSEWSSALAELEQLRRSEAPGKQYYGMIRPMASSGTSGMGYVNKISSYSPKLSAIGWDASRRYWRRTLSHELGHNYSRQHAPCGSVTSWDANYPYESGALSAAPLFDSLVDEILSPSGQYDVMGYCNGSWFSDYNFRGMQSFLEAWTQSTAIAAPAGGSGEVLAVTGTIDAEGVRLRPLRRARGAADVSGRGDYSVRLRTAAGALVEAAFDAVEVDHADPPERHFFLWAPAPAVTVSVVEVTHQGSLIPLSPIFQVRDRAGGRVAAQIAPTVDWREAGGMLELSWNVSSFRYLSVTHVLGAARTVAALDLSGGTAQLDISALPKGGEFEFSLSDGLDTKLVIVQR